MIATVLKKFTALLDEETRTSSDSEPLYHFVDSPMTRQRLNELLSQTPALPPQHPDA